MTIEQVTEAEAESKRFLKKVQAVKEAYKENKYLFYGSKETGALKRSSMDLSRALTALRQAK